MSNQLDFRRISNISGYAIAVIVDVIFKFVLLIGAISAFIIGINMYPTTFVNIVIITLALLKLLVTGLAIAFALIIIFKIGDVMQKINEEQREKAERRKKEFWEDFNKNQIELKQVNARSKSRTNRDTTTTKQTR